MTEHLTLKDKVIIITGAAQGIGEQFALGLARRGARIVLADIADGRPVAEAIRQAGGAACFTECDVSDPAACANMADFAQARYRRIDALIANAAVFSQLPHRSLLDIPLEEWDRVMAVNVRGLWLSVRAVAPVIARQGGAIINIATNRVFTGVPDMMHYDASKGAVMAMTRVMAVEFGPQNIRVNAIAPGLTLTERVSKRDGIRERQASIIAAKPIKRVQKPEDIVGAAAFLLSDDSAQITGQTIVVDGGSIMR